MNNDIVESTTMPNTDRFRERMDELKKVTDDALMEKANFHFGYSKDSDEAFAICNEIHRRLHAYARRLKLDPSEMAARCGEAAKALEEWHNRNWLTFRVAEIENAIRLLRARTDAPAGIPAAAIEALRRIKDYEGNPDDKKDSVMVQEMWDIANDALLTLPTDPQEPAQAKEVRE